MNISVVKNIDYAIISLEGKIDAGIDSQFVEKMHEVLVCGKPNLLLDLTAVSFISSMGISTLIEAKNFTINNGGRFIITGLCGKIKKVFELTGILKSLEIQESVDSALELIHSKHDTRL